jgi:ABC-type Co2+ transport system permease subunit
MRQQAWTVLATIALLLVALLAFGGCVAERVNTQGMTTENALVVATVRHLLRSRPLTGRGTGGVRHPSVVARRSLWENAGA